MTFPLPVLTGMAIKYVLLYGMGRPLSPSCWNMTLLAPLQSANKALKPDKCSVGIILLTEDRLSPHVMYSPIGDLMSTQRDLDHGYFVSIE